MAAGTVIFRQGDAGDRYHIVAAGSVEIWSEGEREEDGGAGSREWSPDPERDRRLALLGPGDGFGEMAIIQGAPRMATALASSDSTLLTVHRDDFVRAINEHRGLALALDAELSLRHVVNFLGDSSPFAHLPDSALRWLALRLEPVRAAAGQDVVRAGDAGDGLYIVRSGQVAVLVRRTDGGEQRIATLGPGDPFGEGSLVTDEPRTATVRATEDAELLHLATEDFRRIVAEHGDRESYFRELVLRRQRPLRIAQWTMERLEEGGAVSYVLTSAATGRYLRLSAEAAFLWDLMDGQRTVRDLTVAYFQRYQKFAIDDVLDTIVQLSAAGFVRIQRMRSAAGTNTRNGGWWRRLGLGGLTRYVSGQIALPDVDALVGALHRRVFRWLYLPAVQVLLLVITLGGAVVFIGQLFTASLPRGEHAVAILGIAAVVGYALHVFLHEIGHAVTCKHFGRTVRRAGIGWFLFLPVAFVDTSDIWMRGKWERASVSFAGPYTNLMLAGAAMLALPVAPGLTAQVALSQFAVTGYLLGLLNMNPLIEFDGYYVLMDWVEIPNLRSKALAFLGKLIWRRPRADDESRHAGLFSIYGLLALVYAVFIASSILQGYRIYVERLAGSLLPLPVAAALGWLLAPLMAWLIVSRAWGELREGAAGTVTRAAGRAIP